MYLCPLPLRERAAPSVQQGRVGEGCMPHPSPGQRVLKFRAALSRKQGERAHQWMPRLAVPLPVAARPRINSNRLSSRAVQAF
jgi:hypothetical protein